MERKAARSDRREFPRVCLPCRLRYHRIPKKLVEFRNATVRDVSRGGLMFYATESFLRRSCFLLDLYLPGSNPVRSLATVAWIKAMPGEEGYQIGGTFVEPNCDVEAALARLSRER